MPDKIIGFSKLSRDKKISWISKNFLDNSNEFENILNKYLNDDKNIQSIHNSLSENVISNFHLPYSISPNLKIARIDRGLVDFSSMDGLILLKFFKLIPSKKFL